MIFCKRKQRLADANFNICSFVSNSREVNNIINVTKQQNDIVEIIGLSWDISANVTEFNFKDFLHILKNISTEGSVNEYFTTIY